MPHKRTDCGSARRAVLGACFNAGEEPTEDASHETRAHSVGAASSDFELVGAGVRREFTSDLSGSSGGSSTGNCAGTRGHVGGGGVARAQQFAELFPSPLQELAVGAASSGASLPEILHMLLQRIQEPRVASQAAAPHEADDQSPGPPEARTAAPRQAVPHLCVRADPLP